MVPLKKIKNGIQAGNWNLVAEGYNALTGENVVAPAPNELRSIESIIEALKGFVPNPKVEEEPPVEVVKPKRKYKKKQVTKPSHDTGEDEDESSYENIPTGIPSYHDNKLGAQPIPFTTEVINPKRQLLNQAVAQENPNSSRREYKPTMIKCGGCGKEYDGKKNYYGGVIGTQGDGTTKYKCPYCKVVTIE